MRAISRGGIFGEAGCSSGVDRGGAAVVLHGRLRHAGVDRQDDGLKALFRLLKFVL
jgi:hypothetical protein